MVEYRKHNKKKETRYKKYIKLFKIREKRLHYF